MNQEVYDKLDEVTDKSIQLADKLLDEATPRIYNILDRFSDWLTKQLESEPKSSK